MKTFSLLFVNFILFSGVAHADLKRDIYDCTLKKGDLERVSCYDEAAKSNGIYKEQSKTVPISDVGKWSVVEKVNPIDDSKTSSMVLVASSGEGRYGGPVAIVIRCLSNETSLFINWSSYMGSDSSSVISRVGSNSSKTEKWSHSTDNKATFKSRPISFIKSMLGETKVVFQATPYSESPVTAIFDISGIDNAIKSIQDNCGWE